MRARKTVSSAAGTSLGLVAEGDIERKETHLPSTESGALWLVVAGGFLLQCVAGWHGELTDDGHDNGNTWEFMHNILYGSGVNNWEWHPKHALRSPAPLLPFIAFGYVLRPILPADWVYFCLSMLNAAIGMACNLFLKRSIDKRYGTETGFYYIVLCFFHFANTLVFRRVQADSWMAFGHVVILGYWLQGRHVRALQAGTLLLTIKVTFAPVLVIIGLEYLLRENYVSLEDSFKRFVGAVAAILPSFFGTVAAVTVVDSLWFGRFTSTTFNHFWFNFVDNKSHWFGHMEPDFYYEHFFMADHMLLLEIFIAVTFVLYQYTWDDMRYGFMHLVATFILQHQRHKQIRFLWMLLPVMQLWGAVGLTRLWRTHQMMRRVLAALLVFWCVWGVFRTATESSRDQEYGTFMNDVNDRIEAYEGGHRLGHCLVFPQPWNSWTLHRGCKRIYWLRITEGLSKDVLNKDEILRFETNLTVPAYINMTAVHILHHEVIPVAHYYHFVNETVNGTKYYNVEKNLTLGELHDLPARAQLRALNRTYEEAVPVTCHHPRDSVPMLTDVLCYYNVSVIQDELSAIFRRENISHILTSMHGLRPLSMRVEDELRAHLEDYSELRLRHKYESQDSLYMRSLLGTFLEKEFRPTTWLNGTRHIYGEEQVYRLFGWLPFGLAPKHAYSELAAYWQRPTS